MSYEDYIYKVLKGRYLDYGRVFQGLCNLTFRTVEVEDPPLEDIELRVYSSIVTSEPSWFTTACRIEIEPPTAAIDLALSIACVSLVTGAVFDSVKLLEDSTLVLLFDNGISLRVSGNTDLYEEAWILQEPNDSTSPRPLTEIHCSNTGFVDEYTIG